ncbi:hypothetical protein [Streptomyces aurantiogriseus]|uniref:Uncharacterized protein n=1 Tax=Streptomyces aurantiogriseus TaxID=66870 RepID=A0A918KZZ1_9ACTN|nr:hypothetical protein [Streptomyces aurantiogriseus]GGR61335.1 hypothetical protein GCM10010251_92640 [Streptomyces aurantiogriseus]
MSVHYITTDRSERYHTGEDCPAFQAGRAGNAAQGIEPRPLVHLTPDEAQHVRQTPCPECCTA